jgi:alcohol dehydrogenase class IV
MLPIFQQ